MINMVITEKEKNMRLDQFLTQKLNFSRNKCHILISNGEIFINQQPQKKSYLLKINDVLTIQIKESISVVHPLEPINLNLKIIYEDSDLAVIVKPHNLIVHPSLSYSGITLINGLLYQIKDLNKLSGPRPGIIHRLDKDTTGLMIIGKTEESILKMQKLMQKKSIKRVYWSIVHGFLGHQGKIDLPIKRDRHNRLKMAVVSGGKPSITYFRTLKRFRDFSLLELELNTGRTHQIRVHLSYLQHPVFGDVLYGKNNLEYQLPLLHAKKINFPHPFTAANLKFEIPLSVHFQKFLDDLEKNEI